MAKKKETRPDIISRSNILINSSYKSTLLENKLTVLALKNVKVEDGKLSAQFTTEQLRHLTGTKGNGLYKTLVRASVGMIGRNVFIENEQEHFFDYINIIERCRFENGIFTVVFSDATKDLIGNLPRNFTQMSIGTLFSFKSNYAYRLYELLKTKEYAIPSGRSLEVEYGLSDFKLKMNCIDTSDKKIKEELSKKTPDLDKIVNELSKDVKNKRWSNFKTKVVDVAVEELNGNDQVEFYVEYEPMKSGRGGKVVGIRFRISKKAAVVDGDKVILISDVMKIISPIKITDSDALAIINAADGDINKIKDAYELSKKQIYIDNFVAWLIAAIKNGYKDEPVPVSQGDPTVGKEIKNIKDNLSDQENRVKIAEKFWEDSKTKEDFFRFMKFIENRGIDFRMYDMLEDADTKYKQYIDWKLGNLKD